MFAIAPYLVEVRDDSKQEQDLWDFFHKNTLHDVLTDYFQQNLNKYQSSTANAQRMFMVSHLCAGTPTSVAGIYKTGQFGFESQIYSINAKKVTHNRKTDEADMLPFYFSFYMPKNTTASQRTRGLLLLGRFHALGVRHITVPHLQQHFKQRFNSLSLNVSRVVPKMVVESLLKDGTLKTIRLVKKNLPTDIADVFSQTDRDQIQEIEMVFRSKRKSCFQDVNWILNAFESNAPASQIITIPSFPHDNVKLEVQLDGRKRTINIGKPGNISSNIELDLQPDTDGHPKISEWLEAADDLAANIVASWGVSGANWKSQP